jgi:hypothetical protein
MRTLILPAMIAGCFLSATAMAAETLAPPSHAQGSPPNIAAPNDAAGEIISLTDSEIADLRSGAGMELARAAELNGHPGPAHAIELADALDLTPEQLSASEVLRTTVQDAARPLGARILAAEATLARGFALRTLDAATLKTRVMALASLQGELKFIHLEAHLAERALLTEAQVARYDVLRGHADLRASSPAPGQPPHDSKN